MRDFRHFQNDVGGVMVTLAALTFANDLSIGGAAATELDRITQPKMMEKIRGKLASKPHRSPLPGDYKHAEI